MKPLLAIGSFMEALFKPLRIEPPLFRRRVNWFVKNRAFSIDKARQSAWISAVSLANARDDAERLQVRESISDRASLLARLILKPSARGRLLQLLQRIERMAPWWESLHPA